VIRAGVSMLAQALGVEWAPRGVRVGRPEDLSGLVGFLASGASAYLTSQTIVIDGGYTAV
jgi:NAD(P)-dependent dehydrogenase (short-subunit alcohol dehydrogenase family)